jgi:phospholipase C
VAQKTETGLNANGKLLLPTDIQGDFIITGFRVPLIVISPFSKAHFVSHAPMDYTAVLKFIETRFSLPNLTAPRCQPARYVHGVLRLRRDALAYASDTTRPADQRPLLF